MIDEVAKLQDLYQKHLPESPPGSLRFTVEFCQAGINALPALLDVLGEIRAGDADLLDEILECGILWNEYQSDVLRRYRDMAKRMEELI